MRYSITHRNTCRICNAAEPFEFLRLKKMPFTDEFVRHGNQWSELLEDIPVYVCKKCWSVQTQHDVDIREYYNNYQYSVGGSLFASCFMKNLSDILLNTYFPGAKKLDILEIGSGDGEQLFHFKQSGHKVLGFEPSSILCQAAKDKGVKSIQGFFTDDSINDLPDRSQKFDIILLSYTLDHIPNPASVLATIKHILNPHRGILVIESHDVNKILHRNEYCLFEHEHSIYLTKHTAQYLLNNNNMRLIGINPLPESSVRANSLIFIGAHNNSIHPMASIDSKHFKKMQSIQHYINAALQIKKSIIKIENFIDKYTQNGKTVAGYGAGGRGVMTLAPVRNAKKLKYLSDLNPKGSGLLTPGSHIPVIKASDMEENRADIIIVFSFGYYTEIVGNLRKYGYKPNQLISLLDILQGKL